MHSKIIINPLLKHYWWLIALSISMSLASFSAQAELTLEDYLSKEPMPGKFNLCAYSSHEFEELEQRLHEVIVGKKVEDLENYFVNMDPNDDSLSLLFEMKKQSLVSDFDFEKVLKFQFIEPDNKKIRKISKSKMQELLDLPIGQIHIISYQCPVLSINKNEWLLLVFTNEHNIATRFELDLNYIDDDFSLRSEPIQKDRFGLGYSYELEKAINQIWVPKSISRSVFKEKMNNMNYWLYGSCDNNKNVDIYVPQPPTPDTLVSIITYPSFMFYDSTSIASINAEFSDNDVVVSAKFINRVGKCKALAREYFDKVDKWIFEYYPDSGYAKFIEFVNKKDQNDKKQRVNNG